MTPASGMMPCRNSIVPPDSVGLYRPVRRPARVGFEVQSGAGFEQIADDEAGKPSATVDMIRK